MPSKHSFLVFIDEDLDLDLVNEGDEEFMYGDEEASDLYEEEEDEIELPG